MLTPYISFAKHYNFTPKELKVATLTRAGKTSKEIAMVMGVAPSAIDTHRKHIRKKLGIDRKTNLIIFLQSIR